MPIKNSCTACRSPFLGTIASQGRLCRQSRWTARTTHDSLHWAETTRSFFHCYVLSIPRTARSLSFTLTRILTPGSPRFSVVLPRNRLKLTMGHPFSGRVRKDLSRMDHPLYVSILQFLINPTRFYLPQHSDSDFSAYYSARCYSDKTLQPFRLRARRHIGI